MTYASYLLLKAKQKVTSGVKKGASALKSGAKQGVESFKKYNSPEEQKKRRANRISRLRDENEELSLRNKNVSLRNRLNSQTQQSPVFDISRLDNLSGGLYNRRQESKPPQKIRQKNKKKRAVLVYV